MKLGQLGQLENLKVYSRRKGYAYVLGFTIGYALGILIIGCIKGDYLATIISVLISIITGGTIYLICSHKVTYIEFSIPSTNMIEAIETVEGLVREINNSDWQWIIISSSINNGTHCILEAKKRK